FHVSTGARTRKARNLMANPSCVVCSEHNRGQIILEGVASPISDPQLWNRFAKVYQKKYDFDMSGYSADPLYQVRPRVIFGFWEKDFTGSATRWQLPGNRRG